MRRDPERRCGMENEEERGGVREVAAARVRRGRRECNAGCANQRRQRGENEGRSSYSGSGVEGM